MEHNLAAAAKLYINIYREQLGSLLGVTPDKAEIIAANMISEGRLAVCIVYCLTSSRV